MTTKIYPRSVRVEIFIIAVDQEHGYSNELEKANQDIYDDFQFIEQNPLVSMVYAIIPTD